ncbi:MAG: peptide ABC transporter substrate-binding protein [Oscillospiraceae bacterium]|nr:peptide ABC transporter substrate-binding protein [Oscillospiraceae bacterium]
MNKTKRVLLSAVLLFLFIGCSESDGGDYIFKYDISSNPRTLDPQTATDENSKMVIANMFQGLLKLDERGNVTAGVAGEYFVSDDGLTYTFQLRDDVYWYTGRESQEPALCTAQDFVFGFRRLINPTTKSPNAERFFVIKNARAINSGELNDITALGVEAIDNFNLVIRLEYADLQFPELLTTTAAMPCNEDFYNSTQGRYGLNAEAVISNGSFWLFRWDYDPYSSENNHLILRRNTPNNEVDRIYPYGLNFFISAPERVLPHFLEGDTHSIVASGQTAQGLINEFPFDEYENFVWGLVFNTKGESVFADKDFRFALSRAFGDDDIAVAPVGFNKTGMLIPFDVKLGNDRYRDLGVDFQRDTDLSGAKAAFERALKRKGVVNINGLDLLVPDNPTIKEFLGFITQKWQKELGFYCNIRMLPPAEFEREIAQGNFQFAATRLSGDYNSPCAYLKYFVQGERFPIFSKSSEYAKTIEQAQRTPDKNESFALYQKAERHLIDNGFFIPLCYQTEYFFYQKGCVDIVYNPFAGTIDYSKAKLL